MYSYAENIMNFVPTICTDLKVLFLLVRYCETYGTYVPTYVFVNFKCLNNTIIPLYISYLSIYEKFEKTKAATP